MAAILITGANQGIGYHLTAALLRQGHQVAVLDWETHHLAALQNTFPTQLAYYPVDVRQGEALQAAVAAAQAWQGTPEVVIHNACCCPFGGVEDLDLGQVQAAFATNYYGALQLVRCVGPALRAQGRGLARRLFSPRFLLCHSLLQKVQTLLCYAFPLPMGSLLAKLTARYQGLTPQK